MQRILLICFLSGLGLLAGCQKAEQRSSSDTMEPASAPAPSGNVVDLVARGTEFDGPESVASGWVTFVFHNQSSMTHFAVVEKLPDGVGRDEMRAAGKVFQDGMDLINAGDAEAGMERLGDLPAWGRQVVYSGGPGLLGPGRTARTTVFLKPGHYMIECYVKTDGRFHSYNPDPSQPVMEHELTVTEADGGAPEPSASVDITLSSEHGIEAAESFPAGPQTVAVHFADQTVYGNFLGHDLHLVKLDKDGDAAAVAAWMNWLTPDGLNTPAPAEFLGGTQDAPAGATVYFDVDLAPGRYAWVSEVPDPASHDLLKTFTVVAPAAD